MGGPAARQFCRACSWPWLAELRRVASDADFPACVAAGAHAICGCRVAEPNSRAGRRNSAADANDELSFEAAGLELSRLAAAWRPTSLAATLRHGRPDRLARGARGLPAHRESRGILVAASGRAAARESGGPGAARRTVRPRCRRDRCRRGPPARYHGRLRFTDIGFEPSAGRRDSGSRRHDRRPRRRRRRATRDARCASAGRCNGAHR